MIDVSDGTIPDAPPEAILVCYGSHPEPCPVLIGMGYPVPNGEHGVVLAINEQDAVHFAFANSYRRVLLPETPLLLVNRAGTPLGRSHNQGGS